MLSNWFIVEEQENEQYTNMIHRKRTGFDDDLVNMKDDTRGILCGYVSTTPKGNYRSAKIAIFATNLIRLRFNNHIEYRGYDIETKYYFYKLGEPMKYKENFFRFLAAGALVSNILDRVVKKNRYDNKQWNLVNKMTINEYCEQLRKTEELEIDENLIRADGMLIAKLLIDTTGISETKFIKSLEKSQENEFVLSRLEYVDILTESAARSKRSKNGTIDRDWENPYENVSFCGNIKTTTSRLTSTDTKTSATMINQKRYSSTVSKPLTISLKKPKSSIKNVATIKDSIRRCTLKNLGDVRKLDAAIKADSRLKHPTMEINNNNAPSRVQFCLYYHCSEEKNCPDGDKCKWKLSHGKKMLPFDQNKWNEIMKLCLKDTVDYEFN